MPTKDNALPENSKENLDRKLDHAIEETFPSSDPVSVSVTKGGAIDYDAEDAAASAAPGGSGSDAQSTAENLLGQSRETVASAAGTPPGSPRSLRPRQTLYALSPRALPGGRAVLPRGHPHCASPRSREPAAHPARRCRHWLCARLDDPRAGLTEVEGFPITLGRGEATPLTGPNRAHDHRFSCAAGFGHVTEEGYAQTDAPGQMTGKPLIESDRVEGTTVYDPHGNNIGSIKRLMIEKVSGKVAYAVMSFGGFVYGPGRAH